MLCRFGPVRRDAAGAGHRLPEGRVDAPVGRHLGQQALAVGRAQLLHLAVGQQRLDDRVVPPQALERLGVGREAGLGLLARGEAELVVEDGPQLRRRVDVELVPGVLLHLGLQGGRRLLQRVGDRLQLGPVHADAGHLHLGQDPDQRRLDVVVQLGHVLGVDAVPEAQGHAGHVGRLARALLGQVALGLARLGDVEAELPGLLAQLGQLGTRRSRRRAGRPPRAVSMARPVRSMPSGSSERMASLTSWPTKGRASTR